ncbi:MAG: hypothetical protein Q9220_000689 [cf. Caloplaca sp. 1 TL-2023]
MSVGLGFSIGDIIASGKLAKDIYDNCFTREQAADVKYLRFRQEINSLRTSLHQLETILHNAGSQRSRRPWETDVDHFGQALQILPEVTGDFRKTLKDCEKLLRDHARLQHARSSIADNLAWWATTEQDVNNLRERVTFHITKISFIAKPFQTQLLLEIQRELRSVAVDVGIIKDIIVNGPNQPNDASNGMYLQSIHLPDNLQRRFVAALETRKPITLNTESHWPVKEGFNALVFHFAKSTVEFNSRQRLGQNMPDGPQYLNLLKALWTMRQLKESPHFQSTGHDSLWADYMRELEVDIKVQFRRFDTQQLVRPPEDAILQLPDKYYSIWVDEDPPLRSLDLVEQRPLEEKILELALPAASYGTRKSSLTVIRRTEYEFRCVTTTKMTDNPLFHSEEGSNINLNSTRLIPAYATPGVSEAANNLALCNDRGEHEEWLSLKSPGDVASMQRALTGYRIHHDMSDFTWCINGSDEPGDSGTGRLQLWQLKPLAKIQAESDPRPYDRQMSRVDTSSTMVDDGAIHRGDRSPDWRRKSAFSGSTARSQTTGSDRRSLATSNTSLVSGSSITATVNGPRGDGVELMRPEVPVLIIFTMCKGRYTFLHLKLEPSIFVNPKSCSCSKPKKQCRRVVLEDKNKKFLTLQKLSADREEQLGLFSWDLATFRYPRRPEFGKVKTVDKTKYLDLEFSSVSAKEEFLKELIELENVRNVDFNTYGRYLLERAQRHRT